MQKESICALCSDPSLLIAARDQGKVPAKSPSGPEPKGAESMSAPKKKLYGPARKRQRQQEAAERRRQVDAEAYCRKAEDDRRHRQERLAGLHGPIEFTILWNGGWDDLLIDPLQIRELTAEEVDGRGDPWILDAEGQWVRCAYLTRYVWGECREEIIIGSPSKCVRIIRRLGGGD